MASPGHDLRLAALGATLVGLTGCPQPDLPGVPPDAYEVVARHGHFAGMPRSVELRRQVDIDGFPCRRGKAEFDRQGALESCHIAREVVAGGVKLPAGSRVVRLGGALSVVDLAAATSALGHRFEAGTMLGFDAAGRVDRALLNARQAFDGIEVPPGWVRFDEKGRVRAGSAQGTSL